MTLSKFWSTKIWTFFLYLSVAIFSPPAFAELSVYVPPAQNNSSSNEIRIVATESKMPIIEMIKIPGKNYEFGKFEVTIVQWNAVMGMPIEGLCTSCAKVDVSWYDIQKFLTQLNKKTSKQYRLPSESEWLFACEGGVVGSCDNINSRLWQLRTGGARTIGKSGANAYGLHDIKGNVWEWTDSCFDAKCDYRWIRGGSWGGMDISFFGIEKKASPAPRTHIEVWNRYNNNLGFRLVRTLH